MSLWSLKKEERKFNGTKVLFSTNGAETTRQPSTCKKKKKESKYRPYMSQENNLKWIVNLNIKHKPIKLPKDNIGEKPRWSRELTL